MSPARRTRLSHRARPRVLAVPGDGAAAAAIVAEFAELAPALVFAFAPEGSVLAPLTARLKEAFGSGCNVVGCSSAGGFAFSGYRDDSIVAIAFPAAGFRATAVWLRDLRQHMALDWIRTLRRAAAGFGAEAPGWSRFGLLMIDGLCRREELVAATVDAALGDLPVLGGSAGDGLRFGRTHLALDGESHPESAIFCLVASAFPVEEVIFDHFIPASERMVVTEALGRADLPGASRSRLQHLRRAARRAPRQPDLRRPRLPRTGRAECSGRLTTRSDGSRS